MSEDILAVLNQVRQENADEELKALIGGMNDEDLIAAAKKASPYGFVIPGSSSKTVSFSYTNMASDNMRNMTATGMIAFMFKMLSEWGLPAETPPVNLDEWKKNPAIANPPPGLKDPLLLKRYEERRAALEKQVVAREFLLSLFQFDPDAHVTSAYRGNKGDFSRRIFKSDTLEKAVAAGNTVRADKQFVKVGDIKEGKVPATDMEKIATTVVPSADMFSRYDRYFEDHYEEIMALTHDLYGTRVDQDLGLVVYGVFDSKEEADAFRRKHTDNVIAPIINITLNRWVLMGPYRNNRERTEYMSHNTDVLQQMLDAREKDSRLAADITKKRAQVAKKKNIKEMGPDDPAFTAWAKDNKPNIANLGATHFGEKKEEKDECPPDHVEVNVFNISNGGATVNVDKIYNAVEAPVQK